MWNIFPWVGLSFHSFFFLPPVVRTANINYAGSLCLAVQLVLCVGKEQLSNLEHPIVHSGTAAEEREAHIVWGCVCWGAV